MKKFYYCRGINYGYVIGMAILLLIIVIFFGKFIKFLFVFNHFLVFFGFFVYFSIMFFLFYQEKKWEKIEKTHPHYGLILGGKHSFTFLNNFGKKDEIFYENIILIKIIEYKDDYKTKILIKTKNKKYIFYKNNFYTSRFGNFDDFCRFIDIKAKNAEKANGII